MLSIRKLGLIAVAAALVGSGFGGAGKATAASAVPTIVKEGFKNTNGLPLGHTVTVAGGPDAIAGLSSSLASEGLRQPEGVAWLPDGSVAVSDTENHVIRQVKDGKSNILAGASLSYKRDKGGLPIGGLLDGPREQAFFNQPSGIAVDGKGQLYIADSGNHAIRKIDEDGNVTTVAGIGLIGLKDGKAGEALFHQPQDVAVTEDGILYVADTLNHVIRRISPDGEVTTIGTPSTRVVQVRAGVIALAGSYKNGSLSEAQFNEPAGLALDDKGNLYVSDSGNHAIRYIDFGKGTVSTAAGEGPSAETYGKDALYAGSGYVDGASAAARFNSPRGLAWNAENGLLIADFQNHAVRQLKDGRVTTLAGGLRGYSDGIESETQFDSPADVSSRSDGVMFIADQHNGAVRSWTGYKVPGAWQSGKGVTAAYGDQVVDLGDSSVIKQSQMVVPVKTIGKLLGYRLSFNAKNKEMILARGEDVVALRAGGQYMTKEQAGKEVSRIETDIVPYIANGQMMAPLRTVAELLGKDVQWNGGDKLVILRDNNRPDSTKSGTISSNTVKYTPRHMQIVESTDGTQIRYGGYLLIDAYKGMLLGEGDEIVTGSDEGGAQLRILDTEDVITLGNDTTLVAEQLRKVGISNITQINLEAGQAYYDVTDLTRSTDRFEVQSGYVNNTVRGTHFITTVNPLTGTINVVTVSGKVTASLTPTGKAGSIKQSSSPHTISPTQQMVMGGSQEELPPVQFINLEDLIGNASPEVIAQLIKNKNTIDQENEDFIKKKQQELQSGQVDTDESGLKITTPNDLSKVVDNLDNIIGNIAKGALDHTKVSKEELDKLIKSVNETNPDAEKKLDLGHVKELGKQAGLDPELEKERLEAQKRKQDEEKKKLDQQQDQIEKLEQKLDDLLAKMEQQKKQQEEANKRALEEMRRKAEEQLLNTLSPEEKERFLQAMKEAQQEKRPQQLPVVSSGGNSGSGGNGSPPVVNPPVTEPPVTEPPKPEPPTDRTVKVVYSDDMNGELSARPDNYFGSVHFETEGLADDMEVQVRVTLTRDGSPVVGMPVRHGERMVETNAEGSFLLKADGDSSFKLNELTAPENPLEFYAELLESGSYTEKIELLEMKDGQLTALGESVRSIQVSPSSQFEFIGEGSFPAAIDMYWGFHSKAYGLNEDTKVGYELTILDADRKPISLGVLGFRMKPYESVTTLTEPGYEIVTPDSEGVYRVNAGLTAGDMELENGGSDILFRWQQAHVGTYTLRIQLLDVSGDVSVPVGEPLNWIIKVVPTS